MDVREELPADFGIPELPHRSIDEEVMDVDQEHPGFEGATHLGSGVPTRPDESRRERRPLQEEGSGDDESDVDEDDVERGRPREVLRLLAKGESIRLDAEGEGQVLQRVGQLDPERTARNQEPGRIPEVEG